MIAILNYGVGNIQSVIKAFKLFTDEIYFTENPDIIKKSKAIVLPGVSSFGAAMNGLAEKNLISVIKEEINKNKLFLGICIGIQLLFEASDESPGVAGLSIFKGRIKKFSNDLIVPQIGWNTVKLTKKNNLLFKDVHNNEYFYFVHSYFADPFDKSIISSITEYGIDYASSIWQDNIFALQFHPEKSQEPGLQIIKNFVELTKK